MWILKWLVLMMLLVLGVVDSSRLQALVYSPKGENVSTSKQTSVEVVVLFNGDSERGPMQQPLQKLAGITLADLQAAWKEAGIVPYAWEVPAAIRRRSSAFPSLYEIQSYVAFEHECHYDEVPTLLKESQEAMRAVHSEAAKRALAVLISIAEHQSSLGQGISFRSQLISWPPQTAIVPGLPDTPK